MDETLILFGLSYIVGSVALVFGIYSFFTLREIEKDLKDKQKRQTMNAWNYYHDKAKQKSTVKSPFKNL